MVLSVPTLIVMTIIVLFTTSILLAISWLQNQSSRCLFYWSLANLIGTISAIFFANRGVHPDLFTVHLANILLFTGSAIAWAGTRIFAEKSYSKIFIGIGPAIWIALNLFPAIEESMAARTIVSSSIVAFYILASAFDLLSFRNERLMSRYPAIAIMVVHAAFFLARIPAVLIMEITNQRDLLASPLITAIAVETLIYIVAISFLRIALVKERAESKSLRDIATDQLTGATSRRTFFVEAERLLQNDHARERETALFVVDLDHFKTINDQWGHAGGDEVLRELSCRAQKALGAHVLFARLGGEEFAAILSGVESKDAYNLAINLRQAIASRPFAVYEEIIPVTVSIGVAFSGISGHCLQSLLRDADAALYSAKRNGRDRIECAAQEPALLQKQAA